MLSWSLTYTQIKRKIYFLPYEVSDADSRQICLLKFKSQNWDIRMYASCWRWHIYNAVLSFNVEHFYRNYHLETEFVTDCLIASCMHAQLLQLCLTLCDPMDCSLLGSSAHGDSPGRDTEVDWHGFLQGSSRPRDWTHNSYVSCIGRRVLYHWHHLETPSHSFRYI